MLDSVIAELQDGVELLKSSCRCQFSAAVSATVNTNYKAALRVAQRARNVRLYGITVGAGVLAALSCFGYFFLRTPVEHNLFDLLVLEVIAGLIVSIITYFIAKASDEFPKTSGRIKSEHQAILREHFNDIIEEAEQASVFGPESTEDLQRG